MGLEIAQRVGVTLIARAKGRHFLVYHGGELIDYDDMPPPRPPRTSKDSRHSPD
jgi:FdhD protein